MTDRLTIMSWLEGLAQDDWRECHSDSEVQEIARQTLALLKEQDPVKPHYNARTNWYECGACHYSMTSGMHCRGELIPAYKVGFCAKCGKAVMWNDLE